MCVVVGAIVGVGIFFTPSTTAALTRSGSLLLLAWAIGGVIALCGALTFAELGGMYHANGAQYQILRESYGAFPAFLFVFCNATAVQAGAIGIIALICARNLQIVVAANERATSASYAAELTLAVALILVVSAANLVGVRWGSRIQNVTVYSKVFALLSLGVLASMLGRADVFGGAAAASSTAAGAADTTTGAGLGASGLGPVSAVLAALVPALFSFGGWQHALWISGEVREPRRNLPRAIVGGVLIVIGIYLLTCWSYLRMIGVERLATSRSPAAEAVAAVLPVGSMASGRLIAAVIAVSSFGVLNAQLLSGPRLVLGMARDGYFFRVFGVLSPRFKTPAAAILLLAGVALGLLFATGADGVNSLLNGVVFVDSTFFVLTGAALFILRRRRPATERPVRVVLYPFVPALFVMGEIGVLVGAYLNPVVAKAAVVGAIWIAAAALLFLIRFRAGEGAGRARSGAF